MLQLHQVIDLIDYGSQRIIFSLLIGIEKLKGQFGEA